MANSLSYEKVGASATKAGLHKILETINPNEKQKYFCQLIEDIAGDDNYLSFIHCDGAGTKSIISYLYYKETGDPTYFARLAEDSTVMNLDDIYCLGLPQKLTLANTIGRNSFLITDDILAQVIIGYQNFAKKLNELRIPITMSGGETADCGDIVRTLIVDSTIVGRIYKNNLLTLNSISDGDVIVALSSSGKSTYETSVNSGIGSNGLTLARHALLSKEATNKYPEVKDPNIDEASSYSGSYSVLDQPDNLGMTIGDALSSPTRTYAPILKDIYQHEFKNISGVVHLTGGAHGKVLRFIEPLKVVKDNLFTPPPIFDLIQKSANIPDKEMYRVFNMGQRMEIYCKKEAVKNIIEIASNYEVEAKAVGYVTKTDEQYPEVEIKTSNGTFNLKVNN